MVFIMHWTHNKIGQKIINLEAVCMWAMGLENLILVYRLIINKQNREYEFSIIFMVLFRHRSLVWKVPSYKEKDFVQFQLPLYLQQICVFCFLVIVTILYALRQVYRLMTKTLLSPNENPQPSELNQILSMKKPVEQI